MSIFFEVRYGKKKCLLNTSFIDAFEMAAMLCGVTIGENAMIGIGSVVTHDVPAGEVWVGNLARYLKKVEEY